MNVQSVFILVSVLIKQITTSENISPQSREVAVNGDGNCFYRAIVFHPNIDVKDTRWKDIFKMMTYHDAQGIMEIPLTSLTLTLIVGKL